MTKNPIFYNRSTRKLKAKRAAKTKKDVTSTVSNRYRYSLGILVAFNFLLSYVGLKRD